jgi:hypothetical protein
VQLPLDKGRLASSLPLPISRARWFNLSCPGSGPGQGGGGGGGESEENRFWVHIAEELEAQEAVDVVISQQRLMDAASRLRIEDANTSARPGLVAFLSKFALKEGEEGEKEKVYNALSY